eukprot:1680174-Pyramimonas_sp.AAC.1
MAKESRSTYETIAMLLISANSGSNDLSHRDRGASPRRGSFTSPRTVRTHGLIRHSTVQYQYSKALCSTWHAPGASPASARWMSGFRTCSCAAAAALCTAVRRSEVWDAAAPTISNVQVVRTLCGLLPGCAGARLPSRPGPACPPAGAPRAIPPQCCANVDGGLLSQGGGGSRGGSPRGATMTARSGVSTAHSGSPRRSGSPRSASPRRQPGLMVGGPLTLETLVYRGSGTAAMTKKIPVTSRLNMAPVA